METQGMIEVTKVEPIELVKAAYEFSRPQGLGFLQAIEGPLSDDDAQAILDRERKDGRIVASMDYVHGRACKFTIFRHTETGKTYIREDWFDHSPRDLEAMLESVGLALT